MKKTSMYVFTVCISALLLLSIGCSKDKDDNSNPGIKHTGEEWEIVETEMVVVDQSISGQSVNVNETSKGGSFYFDEDGTGSCKITAGGYNKEYEFNWTQGTGIAKNIVYTRQSINGLTVEQIVITFDGTEITDTQMSLDGTILEQKGVSQFTMTGEFKITKK